MIRATWGGAARGPAPVAAVVIGLAAAAVLPVGSTALFVRSATASAQAARKAPSGATVALRDTQIRPARVSIRRGQSVTWRFEDADKDEAHNVTSVGRPHFRGSPDRKAGAFSVRFRRRGVYRYECTIHLNMHGSVRVR